MSIRHRSRWLLLLAGLPLLYLPLRAAEAPPPAAAEQPGGKVPADEAPAPAQGRDPAPAAADKPPPPAAEEEEQVSLDSNLSFPVDI